MIKKYDMLSKILGVPGFLIQGLGYIQLQEAIRQAQSYNFNYGSEPSAQPMAFALLIFLAGTALFVAGLAYYARAKGRSGWWCLWAFANIIGLIVLSRLKDESGSCEVREIGVKAG